MLESSAIHIVHAGFDPLSLLVAAAVSLAVMGVGYILMPKPGKQKPAQAADLESPTTDAGRPIGVIFGTITQTGPNILWWGDKDVYQYEIDA